MVDMMVKELTLRDHHQAGSHNPYKHQPHKYRITGKRGLRQLLKQDQKYY